MDFDFSTFTQNIDDERFSKSLRARPMFSDVRGALSNRGVPKAIVNTLANTAALVDSQTNTDGTMYETEAFRVLAITFLADWPDTTSYTLTRYQMGPRGWEV